MYQALYRKYRPQTFDDVVGQTAVTTTLKNQLITGKLSHAYLFTGTRGTGKTTCAKILAKAVNCENPVDGNPCNCCPSCRGIDAGNILDVQEIDAASNNGVDNVRTIRDDSMYPPAEVKKRVYIIDEVHMLSMAAFNALLKTIEEPPEHLLFILATTELNKVPATILSRCQRFAFRRPTAEDITGRINYVAYQEGIDITPEAAELLGRLADGAFRDGLSLLDQCASATTGVLDVENVYQTLGLAGQQQTSAMMDAIAAKNTPEALKLFSQLYSQGKDAPAMLDELATLARDMLVIQTAPQAGLGMISSTCTAQEAMALTKKFTPTELLRMIDLIQETSGGFKNSQNQRLDAELCLMHLCQPELTVDARDLAARISRVEDDLTARIMELEQKLKSGSFVVSAQPEELPGTPDDGEAPPPWDDADAPPAPEEEQNEAGADSDEIWRKTLEKVLPDVEMQYRSFLQNDFSGRMWGDDLWLTPRNDLAHNMVKRDPAVLETIKKKASVVAGKPVRVRMGEKTVSSFGSDDKFAQLIGDMGKYDNMKVQQ